MDARGGDAREVVLGEVEQLRLASLLFRELRKHTAFEEEFVALRKKWAPLVRAMNGQLPMPLFGRFVDPWFEELLHPEPKFFPSERALTASQAAEYADRMRRLEQCDRKLRRLRGLHRGDKGKLKRIKRARERIDAWAREPRRSANPLAWSHGHRTSRRVQVGKYRDAVTAFLSRWHLAAAPWAEYAVIRHHADYVLIKSDDADRGWLRDHVLPLWPGEHEQFCVPLAVDLPGGDLVRVLRDWHGWPDDPMQLMLDACAEQRGRSLLGSEERAIRSQLRPEIRKVQQMLTSCRWYGFSRRPPDKRGPLRRACWLAERLTGSTWNEIASRDADGTHAKIIARDTRRFAQAIGLEELPRQRRRTSGTLTKRRSDQGGAHRYPRKPRTHLK